MARSICFHLLVRIHLLGERMPIVISRRIHVFSVSPLMTILLQQSNGTLNPFASRFQLFITSSLVRCLKQPSPLLLFFGNGNGEEKDKSCFSFVPIVSFSNFSKDSIYLNRILIFCGYFLKDKNIFFCVAYNI